MRPPEPRPWATYGLRGQMRPASELLFSQVRGGFSLGGRYWVRTSDLFGVNELSG